jgi:hypothetical protein
MSLRMRRNPPAANVIRIRIKIRRRVAAVTKTMKSRRAHPERLRMPKADSPRLSAMPRMGLVATLWR